MTSMSTDELGHLESVDDRPTGVLEQVMDGIVLLDDAVIELADAGSVEAVTQLIAGRIGLPPGKVMRAIDASSDEAMAAICRAAGLSANGFSAVLRMRRRRDPAGGMPTRALATFLQISPESARRVVTDLKAGEDG